MTLAASSHTAHTGVAARRWTKQIRPAAPWLSVAAGFAVLIAFLALTPDGVAEPMQTVAGWLLGGGVAALAVGAVVKGLNLLLDCDGD